MTVIRTPETRFADLPDYPFAPHYHDLSDQLRLHYVDEGPRGAAPVLMMHGEPSWSFLYRHMIGPVADAGYRVLAPDLIGFGKSDKPTERDVFSYAGHVAWMREWVEALDLTGIILACQDWGSLIGLRLVAEMPERFAGVTLANGGLPAGQDPSPAFAAWRKFSQESPVFPIGNILQGATTRDLSDAEVAAYDAPYPDEDSKACARVFPSLVPLGDNVAVPDQIKAWTALEQFDKPFVCAFSDSDAITAGGEKAFIGRVPGTNSHDLHRTLKGNHFIQEDDPEGFVAAILDTAKAAGV